MQNISQKINLPPNHFPYTVKKIAVALDTYPDLAGFMFLVKQDGIRIFIVYKIDIVIFTKNRP